VRRRGIWPWLLAAADVMLVVALQSPVHAATPAPWKPNPVGGLDCNGFSPLQRTVRHMWCTEIAANDDQGFEDNGHYVGHDEPDIGFFSHRHGSGNSMSYRMVLPKDPPGNAGPSYSGPTHEFQLTPAIWFGLTMCDTESYPEGTKTCTPDSDRNIQVPPRADHAGSAFTELQFYPPGWGTLVGGQISCDPTRWCAAFNIDSLQADYGALHGPGSPPGAIANPNCPEPVNFAILTHDGKPVGPPGPDTQNNATFTPNGDTLLMNSGDTIQVDMRDTPVGYVTAVTDLTTHQFGFMVASARNGFRHILWDPKNLTCKGAPYTFHAMYDTAAPPTASGQATAWTTWSAHTDNVAYDVETGHFEKADAAGDPPGEDAPCFDGPQIPGCLGSDFDFDGYPYHADWPNGSPNFPTPNYISSPHTPAFTGPFGAAYPTTRFETDLPRIEEANNGGGLDCDHHTGAGCTNPPQGAQFYPWYHLLKSPGGLGGHCAWALSNDIPGQLSNFGGEVSGWGPLERTDYGFDVRYHNYARTITNPCP
jgi:hypothetical protein